MTTRARPRVTAQLLTTLLVLGMIASGSVALGAWAYGQTVPHRSPTSTNGSFYNDVIKIGTKVGNLCASGATATTCSEAGLKTAAYSAAILLVGAYTSSGPVTPTVGGTLKGKTLSAVTHTTSGDIGTYSYLANNVSAISSATVYANESTASLYDLAAIDVQNVTTSSLSTDAVATGSGTTASCVVSPTVANTVVFFAVFKEGPSTVGTWSASGGDTALTGWGAYSGSTYTYFNAFYQSDASTGSFTISATQTATHGWTGVCVALNAASVPTAPASFAAGTVTTTTVPLTWTNAHASPVVNSTVYQATYSGGSCGAYTTKYSVAAAQAHSYTVTGLTSGNHYCFEATNWNSTGQSAYSTALVNVVTAHVPQAPSAVSVVATYATTNSVSIAWTNPLGTVTGNNVYYGTTSACGGSPTEVSVGVETYAVVAGLSSGTTYYVQVTAVNATGESAKSTCVSATTYTTPTATTLLAASSVTSTQATLSWSQPVGYSVTNDTLYYGGTCGTWTTISAGAVSTYTLTHLTPAKRYCVTVQAWDAGLGGALEHPYLNVTTNSVPPSKPSNLHPTANGTTYVDLKWTQAVASVGSLTNNTVYYGTTCGTWAAKLSTGSPTTTYDLTGLTGSSTYCVAVGAWTSGGEGSLDYTNVTTAPAVPSAPTGLTLVTAGRTVLTFRWTNPVGSLTNNTVFYGTTSGCASGGKVSTGGPTTSWTLSGLAAFTTYYVKVAAWTAGGEGPFSSCVSFVSQPSTPPAPVINLGLTTVGNTYVDLVWSNPAAYTLYNNTVYWGTTCSVTIGGWAHKASTVGVTTSWNVTGLSTYTSYCFAVTAWDGQSNLSVAFEAETGGSGPIPAPPTSDLVVLAVIGAAVAVALLVVFGTDRGRRSRGPRR